MRMLKVKPNGMEQNLKATADSKTEKNIDNIMCQFVTMNKLCGCT